MRRLGRAFAGIEKAVGRLFAGFAQQKETAAAQAGAVRFDHRKGGADGHCRVKGVAAQGQGFLASHGGGGVCAGNGDAFRLGCGLQLEGAEQGQRTEQGAPGMVAADQAAGLHALPVMIRYFCISSSLLSTLFSSSGMQSTGQTCWHCGSS